MVEEPVRYLEGFIRDIPDFPKKGIIFKDITPLLADPAALSLAVELMSMPFKDKGVGVVVGVESRGFIFGSAVARALSCGFVPVRKPGKLPYKTKSVSYELEYGTDTLEIHIDAVKEGQNVLMVDDLLATGGTMEACCKLIKELGGNIVGISFLVELEFLNGREKLKEYEVYSIIKVK